MSRFTEHLCFTCACLIIVAMMIGLVHLWAVG